jgi:hypothetical protein
MVSEQIQGVLTRRYWISITWVEGEFPAKGVKPDEKGYFHRYKIRFDWIDSQGTPWWEDDTPGPLSLLGKASRESSPSTPPLPVTPQSSPGTFEEPQDARLAIRTLLNPTPDQGVSTPETPPPSTRRAHSESSEEKQDSRLAICTLLNPRSSHSLPTPLATPPEKPMLLTNPLGVSTPPELGPSLDLQLRLWNNPDAIDTPEEQDDPDEVRPQPERRYLTCCVNSVPTQGDLRPL